MVLFSHPVCGLPFEDSIAQSFSLASQGPRTLFSSRFPRILLVDSFPTPVFTPAPTGHRSSRKSTTAEEFRWHALWGLSCSTRFLAPSSSIFSTRLHLVNLHQDVKLKETRPHEGPIHHPSQGLPNLRCSFDEPLVLKLGAEQQ